MAQYRIDLDVLEKTCRVARENARALGVDLLMALKGFPLPAAFPTIAPFVRGVTASGLYESRLGRLMGADKEVHVHAPAYDENELDDLCETCSHIVFNTVSQLVRFGARVKQKGKSVGLRINPGFSSADCLKYDPCCPDSRFGVTRDELARVEADVFAMIDGFHLHALCEGYADDFAGMVETFTSTFREFLSPLKWINLGGGEVINDPAFASPRACAAVANLKACGNFRVMIEPSEYLVRESGSIVAKVLDIIHREKDIAILDISASCHATDLMLFDMKPAVVSPALVADDPCAKKTILGAISCLAGDVLGEYTFAKPLAVGDTVVLGGLGCYSFAQQSWFNGIRRPDLILTSRAHGDQTVLSWSYADYIREFSR